MDPETFRDLVAGSDHAQLAAFLQVNLITFRRWWRGESTPPHSAVLCLQLLLHGRISAFFGKEWEDFTYNRRGSFCHPFWRRGFTPGELKAMFFQVQQVGTLQAERDLVLKDLAAARDEIEQLQAQVQSLRVLAACRTV